MRIAAITREPSPGQARPRSRDAGPRALGRALEVLESLARRRDGATLSGLSQRLGSPKSSLLYLLRPMARLGYLVRSADGRYQLGPAAFTLAMAALSNRELPQLARPFLEDLAEKSGETALLATMASDEPLAGLVVGGPSKRLAADQERLGALVVERARELSRVMGFGAEPAS